MRRWNCGTFARYTDHAHAVEVGAILPGGLLIVAETLDEARAIARDIVERRVPLGVLHDWVYHPDGSSVPDDPLHWAGSWGVRWYDEAVHETA